MVRFDILTLFPGMFASTFESSLLKKAREKGLIEIKSTTSESIPRTDIGWPTTIHTAVEVGW